MLLALMLLAQSLICQNGTCAPVLITGNRAAVADVAYTQKRTDFEIAYTTLTATRVVTLLDPATVRSGQRVWVKDESGSASGSVKITLSPANSGTIDGASSLDITTAYGSVELASNGTEYFLVKSIPAFGASSVTSAVTTTDALDVSATSQTSGATVKITSGGANLLTGGKALDVEMGAATVGAGVKVVTSGVYTDTAASPFWIDANGATTATFGIAHIKAEGLTTGSGIVIDTAVPGTMTNAGSAIRVFDGTTNTFRVGVDGHITHGQTTAAVVTQPSGTGSSISCTNGSGDSATCTDTRGDIRITPSADTNAIVLTFHTAYAKAPVCTVSPGNADSNADLVAAGAFVSASTTALTVTGPSANWQNTAHVYHYHCEE